MRSSVTVHIVLFFFMFLTFSDYGVAPVQAATGNPSSRISPRVPPGRRALPSALMANSGSQDNPRSLSGSSGFYVKETEGERFKGVYTTSGRMVLRRREATVPGDVPVAIERIYSTQNASSSYFSTGWHLN